MQIVSRISFTQKDKERFEEYLRESGKHYYDLAADLRLSRAYINQLFSGLRTFGLKRLKDIETWCGFEFDIEDDYGIEDE